MRPHHRHVRTATAAEQDTVRLAIRVHTSDGPHPVAVSQLVETTGLDQGTVRAAIRTLRRRGLLHVEHRTSSTGAPAPSRYHCTMPRRPDPTRALDHLMRQAPDAR